MSKKQKSAVLAEIEGIGITTVLYLGLQLLLALLAVRGILPEGRLTAAQCITCAVSVLVGAGYAVRSTHLGTLPAAMIEAGGFALLMILLGFLVYNHISWNGQGGILLLVILASGALAGIIGSRAGRKKKKMSRTRKVK